MRYITIVKIVAILPILLFVGVVSAVDFDNTKNIDFEAVSPGQELGCLAMNIYHEGRGESLGGQAAIASVTMNRVDSKHYPETVCKVVWQYKQFSWTRVASRHHVIADSEAWREALIIANMYISGELDSVVGHATHYHSVDVNPNWQDKTKLVGLVGDHFFYVL